MMKNFLGSVGVLCVFLAGGQLWACPGGQHDECLLPLPWGGCAQTACILGVNIPNPLASVMRTLQDKSFQLAADAKSHGTSDYDDCIPVVAGGLAAAGAQIGAAGGPWGAAAGAALGAGGGVNMAKIACRRIFP